MTRFPTRTIEEVTGTLIDYRGKTPPKTTSGVKLITAKVIKNGSILDGNHEYISEETYEIWMRRGFPKPGDILITTEAPLGEVAQLRTTERVALAQRVILLRGNARLIDQQFYFQALKSPYVHAGLQKRATGTTVAGIKQSELRKVLVQLPPLPVQRKIAFFLSAYDDLIENNLRRIKILEGMAQLIYREWFVNFRFPGHEKVKFVNSKLGKIPEGWAVEPLGALASQVREGTMPNALENHVPYVGLEHIPRKSLALAEWTRPDTVQSTKLRFRKGDILFGKIRPYFHKVAIAPIDGICSSDTIVIRPRSLKTAPLVIGCVSSVEFVAHATQTSQGTKMPRANWDVLEQYPVWVPPEELLNRFRDLVENAVLEIQNLIFRNRNLRQTRDLLLPRLVSGEVDVEDLDIRIPEEEEVPIAQSV